MSSTDRRTDGRTRWIQYTPPSNFVGWGYNNNTCTVNVWRLWTYHISWFSKYQLFISCEVELFSGNIFACYFSESLNPSTKEDKNPFTQHCQMASIHYSSVVSGDRAKHQRVSTCQIQHDLLFGQLEFTIRLSIFKLYQCTRKLVHTKVGNMVRTTS